MGARTGALPDLAPEALQARHQALTGMLGRDDPFNLRLHRALSWLARARREADDDDARFLFLWIAFNAAYANDLPDRSRYPERRQQVRFLHRLVELDTERLIYQALWEDFPGPIRNLLDNRFVHEDFWRWHRGEIDEQAWRESQAHARRSAHRALGRQDTSGVLLRVFDRLYVLRNQLVHGGATWNSSANRDQVRDATRIMDRLVPILLHLMLEHPRAFPGEAAWPVVRD